MTLLVLVNRIFGNLLAGTVRRKISVTVTTLLLLDGVSFSLRAQDSITLDFPREYEDFYHSERLESPPEERKLPLAAIEIPLRPVEARGGIVATVVFHDQKSLVIQVKWQNLLNKKTTILVDNISENVNAVHSRVLTVPEDFLAEGGRLILETDAEMLPVSRVKLEWTLPGSIQIGRAAGAVRFVVGEGSPLGDVDFIFSQTGQIADTWSTGVWKAYLQETPESIEESLEFCLPMDSAPEAAIFRMEALGFAVGETPEVWINGRRLKGVASEVPPLATVGYWKDDDGLISYAGWRKISAFVPPEVLMKGENSIIIRAAHGAYVKGAHLELSFQKDGVAFGRGFSDSVPSKSSISIESSRASDPDIATASLPQVITVPPTVH